MAFSLRLPGGMRVVISEAEGIRFDSEPSQADIEALELCAQLLFKNVFRYSKADKLAPVWTLDGLIESDGFGALKAAK